MEAAALVALGHERQAVGGFEGKFFEDFHSVGQLCQMAIARGRVEAGGEFISLPRRLRKNPD
ncbi:hypothetical protein PFL02_48570 [Pseudomonas fluorescens]|nr:hypothetical protein PFL02_48570 [Pseudomonas fluorescens]